MACSASTRLACSLPRARISSAMLRISTSVAWYFCGAT